MTGRLVAGTRTVNTYRWRAAAHLVGVGVCLLLAAVIIDPIREMMPLDDGWAYARTVEHLLQTGEYQLDAWSAANMPVQIYLAAGLSKIFGYSLSLVRLTTVGMLALVLASFYGLAREFDAPRSISFAATLGLLASPLVLRLGFSFMSDVQFMGWLLAALFLYVRGLRRASDALVFLGSVAAACAIGTRQFGLAIVVGLLLARILCRPDVRPRLHTLLLGAALPAGAAGWQILMGLQEPNFTQVVRLGQQELYLGQPLAVLAHEFLWRAAIVLQYLGISVLPALPLLVGAAFAYAGRSRRRATRLALLAALIGLGLCAILLTGSPVSGSDAPRRPWPALGIGWLLGDHLPDKLFRPLDLVGLAPAAVLGTIAVVSAQKLWPIRRQSPETILLVATGLCLFGLHLFYVQLNDTYVVPFIPFGLLLLAVQCRGSTLRPRMAVSSTAISLAALVLVSLWIRSNFAEQGTLWAAAERLTKAGVPAAEIDERRCSWPMYRGAFDEWLAAGTPGYKLSLDRVHHSFTDSYLEWMATRGESAAYRIRQAPMSEPGWRLIARDSYRDFAFQQREVLTYQAVDAIKESKSP
ncbi:ArnT family glycosyltransferase [Mycobacterium sp.]|uniref:ArnT family glycosyltransferase n=1 Tax=Mycobacterium sp. TaxID=1785 RepID=UPI003F98F44B